MSCMGHGLFRFRRLLRYIPRSNLAACTKLVEHRQCNLQINSRIHSKCIEVITSKRTSPVRCALLAWVLPVHLSNSHTSCWWSPGQLEHRGSNSGTRDAMNGSLLQQLLYGPTGTISTAELCSNVWQVGNWRGMTGSWAYVHRAAVHKSMQAPQTLMSVTPTPCWTLLHWVVAT